VISRFVIMPEEVPIGVTTAILGAPFFIYLARKGGKRE
jgi:iron complex transport system permease protein